MNQDRYESKFKYGYESKRFPPPHELLITIEELKNTIERQKREIDYFKRSQAFEKFSMEQFRMVKSKITSLEKEKLLLTKQNNTLENRLKTLDYKSDKLLKLEMEKMKLKEKLDEQRVEVMKFARKLSESNSDFNISEEIDKLQDKINPAVKFRKFIKNKSLLTSKSSMNKTSSVKSGTSRFPTKVFRGYSILTSQKKPLKKEDNIPTILKNFKSDLSVNVQSVEPSSYINVYSSKEIDNSVHKLIVQTTNNENSNELLTPLEINERKVAGFLKEINSPETYKTLATSENVTDIQYQVPVLKNSSSIFEVIQCKNGGADDERIIGSFKIINYCKSSADTGVKLRAYNSYSTVEKSKEKLIKSTSKSSSLTDEKLIDGNYTKNYQNEVHLETNEFNENTIDTSITDEMHQKRSINDDVINNDTLKNSLNPDTSQITNQSQITNENDVSIESEITNQNPSKNESKISTITDLPDEKSNDSLDSMNTNFESKDIQGSLESLEDIQKIQPIRSYDNLSDSIPGESLNFSGSSKENNELILPPLLLSSSNFHMNNNFNALNNFENPKNTESVFKVSLRRLEAALKKQDKTINKLTTL